MAPTDRFVAPGTQVVGGDSVQGVSWVNVDDAHGRIGQIFFPTDVATLDDLDMAELEKLVSSYDRKLRQKRVGFFFAGYADPRYTLEHNASLSEQRAQAVAGYVGDQARLGGLSNYGAGVKGLGVDFQSTGLALDAATLAPYRRVDIWAEPVNNPTPNPIPTPQPIPRKPLNKHTEWIARMTAGAGASIGAAVEMFGFDIHDADNEFKMQYTYKGVGGGAGLKKLPISLSGAPSDWQPITTSIPITILDFEGFASHLAIAVQVVVGPGLDMLFLSGPADKCGAERIRVSFFGFSTWSAVLSIGATGTIGALQPVAGSLTDVW
jgi:hypothetical protein